MTYHPATSPRCAQISELLAEFALGTLTGAERSLVLAHISQCTNCASAVEALSTAADTLLELAPHVDAPLGFESRLMERFRQEAAGTQSSHRPRIVAVAAAVLLMIVVAFGVGNLVASDRTSTYSSASPYPASARLASDGHNVGQVFISSGRPAWIYMSVDDDSWSGVAICTVRYRNGHVETVGQFRLKHGYGAWAATIKGSAHQVVSAAVVGERGAVLATARFSA